MVLISQGLGHFLTKMHTIDIGDAVHDVSICAPTQLNS